MSYLANIYQIFIASPGDVSDERTLVRDVLHDWNAIYSPSRRVMLQPVGWETNSIPEMGGHPQKLLNKQLLDDADVLIAVFWTRIGTPTDTHQSGTIEEIEEHLSKGKPALIYFSDLPIRPDSVDDKQYSTLKKFKKSLRDRGLLENYSTIDEFAQKVNRHVHTLFSDAEKFPNPSVNTTNVQLNAINPSQTVEFPPGGGLGLEAMDVLLSAVKSDGKVVHQKFIRGILIQAGEKIYDTSTPRLKAKWINAIEQLVLDGYIRSSDHRGDIYEVSEKGYQFAEILDA